jgi:hypothetical protein
MLAFLIGAAALAAAGSSKLEVQPLPETAPIFAEGGLSQYAPSGAPRTARPIFVDALTNRGGWGNIKINGRIYKVIDVQSQVSGVDKVGDGVGLKHDDVFKTEDGRVVVRLVVTVKRFFEQTDADWEEGEITVTCAGTEAKIAVAGGFAN